MGLIYTPTNKIKFTSISERYIIDPKFKASASRVHSQVISYVTAHFKNTKKYKDQVVTVLNTLTYYVLTNRIPKLDWSVDRPFDNIPEVDSSELERILGTILLTPESIDWDVSPVDDFSQIPDPIEIPKSVVRIEPDAFSECSHLMLFVYPDSSAKDFAEERDLLYSEI